MVRATTPNNLVTQYAYDALDNRIQQSGPAGTTNYLVDPFGANGLAQVMRETDGTGSAIADYNYAGSLLISMQRGNSASFYLSDGQMSTRLLTDASGAVTDSYVYDAFGNILSHTGTSPNEFLFQGQQLDANTGLYYLRARYYNPIVGRFNSVDPFGGSASDPASLHPYTYAHNQPINRADPNGRWTLSELSVTRSIAETLAYINIGAVHGAAVGLGVGGTWSGTLKGALAGMIGGASVGAAIAISVMAKNWYILIEVVLGGLANVLWDYLALKYEEHLYNTTHTEVEMREKLLASFAVGSATALLDSWSGFGLSFKTCLWGFTTDTIDAIMGNIFDGKSFGEGLIALGASIWTTGTANCIFGTMGKGLPPQLLFEAVNQSQEALKRWITVRGQAEYNHWGVGGVCRP